MYHCCNQWCPWWSRYTPGKSRGKNFSSVTILKFKFCVRTIFHIFLNFSQNSEKSAKLWISMKTRFFRIFRPEGEKCEKIVFSLERVLDFRRFFAIFRWKIGSEIVKFRGFPGCPGTSEIRAKSGKNGEIRGVGQNREKRHFARSLPKTLHFFATFPISRNGWLCRNGLGRKPSNFATFAGRAKHAKLGRNLPIFPDFSLFSQGRNQGKNSSFSPVSDLEIWRFSRVFRPVATRDFTILRKIEKTRATHNFATFSRNFKIFKIFHSLTKSRKFSIVWEFFSWTHDRLWKCYNESLDTLPSSTLVHVIVWCRVRWIVFDPWLTKGVLRRIDVQDPRIFSKRGWYELWLEWNSMQLNVGYNDLVQALEFVKLVLRTVTLWLSGRGPDTGGFLDARLQKIIPSLFWKDPRILNI